MNLILLSRGLGALARCAPPLTLGFIPTASELSVDQTHVRSERHRLERLGYTVIDLDITNMQEPDLRAGLEAVDAVFVVGGDPFYLMQQIKRRQLKEPLRAHLRAGKPYFGSSAGAIICGPSLEPIAAIDDSVIPPDQKSFDALELVDFVPLPHRGAGPGWVSRHEEIEREFSLQFNLVPFRDDQAIVATGSKSWTIVDSAVVPQD